MSDFKTHNSVMVGDHNIILGDILGDVLPGCKIDMVFTSPPYADARTYGIGAQRNCEEWVSWMADVVERLVSICDGPVFINCAGVTRRWNYWPCPEGLSWECRRRGIIQRRPAFWRRVGIPGSGGRDYLRADVEYVLCFMKKAGRLAWSDNTANGHPPKWGPGGEMSHRVSSGARVNEWGKVTEFNGRRADGTRKKKIITMPRDGQTQAYGNSNNQFYKPPKLSNPGNLIEGIPVGGGLMGHPLAHKNEAPFPVKLAEWFIRSFCPPGGVVFDPFAGSGTVAHAAHNLGRRSVSMEIREDQCEIINLRLSEILSPNPQKQK